MKTRRIVIFLFMTLAYIANGNAQDVTYSQFYANPLYLNPALAGSKLSQRITFNYRNQWPNIVKGYISYSASWDQHFDKISGALGVIVNSDVAGAGTYNKLSGSGIYVYQLRASRNIVVNAALQAGYFHYRLDWNKLKFGDDTETAPRRKNIGNVDFSAGLLAGYKEILYFGLAVNHLSQPNISFYEGPANRMELRYTLHSGVLIDFFERMEGDDYNNLSIAPNIVYVQQGNFKQLNAGMSVNLFPLIGGLWLRQNFNNPDGAIAMLGFQQKNYKIGYSYDYTISKLTSKTGGAHEISIVLLFPKPKTIRRFCEIRDPNF